MMKKARLENDAYMTQVDLVKPLAEIIRPSGIILEPCVGTRNILNGFDKYQRNDERYWVTNDIDEKFYAEYHLDAAEPDLWNRTCPINWVVTNPPYSQPACDLILRYALDTVTNGVAMLLRLSMLEPACRRSNRYEILDEYADNMRYILPFSGPRPKFREGSGTEFITTAWFVWYKGWSWKQLGVRPPFQFSINWKEN